MGKIKWDFERTTMKQRLLIMFFTSLIGLFLALLMGYFVIKNLHIETMVVGLLFYIFLDLEAHIINEVSPWTKKND